MHIWGQEHAGFSRQVRGGALQAVVPILAWYFPHERKDFLIEMSNSVATQALPCIGSTVPKHTLGLLRVVVVTDEHCGGISFVQ